jgi:hypothetical protein
MIVRMTPCSYVDPDGTPCGRHVIARGLCQTHYQQNLRGESLRPINPWFGKRAGACTGPRCRNLGNYGGLCWSHHQQRLRDEPLRPLLTPEERKSSPCCFDGCGRPGRYRGLCQTHNKQRLRTGKLVPIHVPKYRYRSTEGYIRLMLPEHPHAGSQGRVLEHVVVMVDKIGRPLFPDETVHHINGVRDDNRPENLELWTSRHPPGQRVEDKVAWAREMLARYAPEDLREGLVVDGFAG